MSSNSDGKGEKYPRIDRLTAPKGQQGSILSRLNGPRQGLLASDELVGNSQYLNEMS